MNIFSEKHDTGYLNTIFQNINSGIMLINPENKIIVDINDYALKLIGLPKGQVVGKICHNFVCPQQEGNCPIVDLGKEVDKKECLFLNAEGKEIPIVKTVTRVMIDGSPFLLESFFDISKLEDARDEIKKLNKNMEKRITERTRELEAALLEGKKKEQILIKNEEKQRQTLESVNLFFEVALDMLCIVNFEGYFLKLNKSFTKILGWSEEELLARPCVDFIHKDDREETLKLGEILNKHKKLANYENRYLCKDGSYRWVSWTCSAAFEQGIVIASGRDITEQRKAQNALQESEQRLRNAVIESPVPIMIHAEDGEVILLSNSWTEITGYTHKDIPTISGWTRKAFARETQIIKAHIDRLYQEQKRTYEGEFVITTKHNTKRTWDFYSSPLGKLADGRRSIISIGIDITDRKLVERELTEAKNFAEKANKAKSEFLANMSHEIRTPLNAILGFGKLLSDTTRDSQEKEYLQSIRSAGTSLLTLINDILDLSRIEAGKMKIEKKSVNLLTIFNEIKQIFTLPVRDKGLSFTIHLSPDLPEELIIDEIRLRQILFNLVGNAVKFTEQGTITVAAQKKSCNKKKKIDLIISVHDTGIGIPQEDYQTVFESFKQTMAHDNRQYGGTGLGLAITKKLVEMMNGEIELVSLPGEGTTFTIILHEVKLTDETGAGRKIAHGEDSIRFNGSTALIVDHSETSRKELVELFQKLNLEPIEARDLHEALFLTGKIHPNLICMDIHMPGEKGFQAAENIKNSKNAKNIPIIALTELATIADGEHISEYGFDGFVIKPVNSRNLQIELMKHLPYSNREDHVQNVSELPSLDNLELRAILDREIVPKLKKLVFGIKIGDIKEVSTRIITLGNRFSSEPIIYYGKKMLESARQYDITGIEKSIQAVIALTKSPEKDKKNERTS